jgi:aspartate aminotransferase-like enzyme
VPKGKPWSIEEELALKQLVTAGHPLETIAERLGKLCEAVRQKIRRLGLEVVEQDRSVCTTTSSAR